MTKSNQTNTVAQFNVDLDAALAHLASFVESSEILIADKEFNVDDRWECYSILCKKKLINKMEECSDGFLSILGYNDTCFVADPQEELSYVELYSIILDRIGCGDIDGTNLDQWREAVMASGYSTFVYDPQK